MSQEERSFQEYLGKIHAAYTSEKLSYFEHNLEVRMEWGQGWGIVTHGQIGLGSGRKGTLNPGSFPPTLIFQTWRQMWRVLEMSDIVLLITDIRHPVSTGMRLGKPEKGERFLWGEGQRQELGDRGILSSLFCNMLMSVVRDSVLYLSMSQPITPFLVN